MKAGAAIRRVSAVVLAIGVASGVTGDAAGARSITDAWPRIAGDSDGDCKLDITGNGKFMLIAATGLQPRETAHLGVTNAAMRPIDWNIHADFAGRWSLIYLPLLWNNGDGTIRDNVSSGTVAVRISTPECEVTASAPWHREVRVIP